MSFRIDNFVIDRVLRAYLLDSNDELIGYLDNLTDCSIEMGSETQDVTDALGVLIKRFYRSKTASLTANNALFNLNVSALQLGSTKTVADSTATSPVTFKMPFSTVVKAGNTATLTGADIATIKVYGLTNSGSATIEYGVDTTASQTKYSVTSGGVLTPPTATDETQYFVYYEKEVKDGIKYANSATEFPPTVKIRIEVLGYDVCDTTATEPQVLVIAGDSFNISPDATLSISGGEDQSVSFSGEFAAAYCGDTKSLFDIYLAED